jgi:hypothetical protein
MLQARVVPRPKNNKFKAFSEFTQEFVPHELGALNINNTPLWFDHDATRRYNNAGRVTRQWLDDQGNLCADIHLTNELEAFELVRRVKSGEFKEVSLYHQTFMHGAKPYTKVPVEISVCKKGRRDSPILKCLDHSELRDAISKGELPAQFAQEAAFSVAAQQRLVKPAVHSIDDAFEDPSSIVPTWNSAASFSSTADGTNEFVCSKPTKSAYDLSAFPTVRVLAAAHHPDAFARK